MGLKEFHANGGGFMFFIFDNTDSCGAVLEGGPWYMGNQLLLLKKWRRMLKLTKEYVSQILVWVKLFHIPMEYWDYDGLSRIASKIGTPLFMDYLTSSGTRVSFARVCVEVNVDSSLPPCFFVKCGEDVVEIRVEYQGIPTKCDHCKVFGHDTKRCITNQVAQLVQLQKETKIEKNDGWKTVKAKGKKKIGESKENTTVAPILLTPPSQRVSSIPGVNEEAPLKDLHQELLGLAQVLTPKAN
ncbi:hypothetical protein ACSBR1_029781 [Camellia fascicularis]